jgi:hypothetical protein
MGNESLEVSWSFFGVPTIVGKWEPDERERQTAWALLTECLTRKAVAEVPKPGHFLGAIESLEKIYRATEEILEKAGPGAARPKRRGNLSVTEVALAMSIQVLLPFLQKWRFALLEYIAARPKGEISQVDYEQRWERYGSLEEEFANLRFKVLDYLQLLAEAAGRPELTPIEAQQSRQAGPNNPSHLSIKYLKRARESLSFGIKFPMGIPTLKLILKADHRQSEAASQLFVCFQMRVAEAKIDEETRLKGAKTVLESLNDLVHETRKVLREAGPSSAEPKHHFSVAGEALRVVNDVLRPFFSTWRRQLFYYVEYYVEKYPNSPELQNPLLDEIDAEIVAAPEPVGSKLRLELAILRQQLQDSRDLFRDAAHLPENLSNITEQVTPQQRSQEQGPLQATKRVSLIVRHPIRAIRGSRGV